MRAVAEVATVGRANRVVHVVDALSVGGAERHVVDLAHAQAHRGHDVHVVCSAGGPLAAEVQGTAVHVHVLGSVVVKRRFDARFAIALRRVLTALRPDIVHAHLYASIICAAVATAGRSYPLVVTEQTEAPWRGRGARLASRLAYRRAGFVIGASSRIERQLVEHFGVPPDRVMTVVNSVTAADCCAKQIGTHHLSRRYAPVVGVVARLVVEKGVDVLLESAVQVLRTIPRVRFVIIGDGPLRRDLEARARVLSVADHVSFMGLRSDVAALLRTLDLLAVPSRAEGTPLIIVEAMHAGVPVVATDAGGIPDQVTDGVTGLLVPTGDADALAAAIVRLLDDRWLAARLAATALRDAEHNFKFESMVHRIDVAYQVASLSR